MQEFEYKRLFRVNACRKGGREWFLFSDVLACLGYAEKQVTRYKRCISDGNIASFAVVLKGDCIRKRVFVTLEGINEFIANRKLFYGIKFTGWLVHHVIPFFREEVE